MNIEEFKNDVVNHTVKPGIVIFENSDNSFVANQYIREIAKQRRKSIDQIDDISEISGKQNDIFGMAKLDSILHVCRMKEFDAVQFDPELIDHDDIVIVCEKALGGPRWDDKIVKIPKLEDWQIKDFMYSLADGVDHGKLDWLQELCNNDIYRISEEIDKVTLFEKDERNKIFEKFISDNVFSDLSTYNIFNMSNAIINRDLSTLSKIWSEIDRIDVDPLAMVTVMRNNIRNIIKIQLSTKPTAESTGMSPKQFYAVSKSCGRFSKDKLIDMLSMLTSIDKRLKNGELPADLILDYIILNILK